jgi:hypothetical protein
MAKEFINKGYGLERRAESLFFDFTLSLETVKVPGKHSMGWHGIPLLGVPLLLQV